jgi:L-rhamnose mutarotase
MPGKKQRMGQVIGVRPEALAEYKRVHADVWPEIRALLSDCNITNYSIYLREPENLLFAYWEYVGDDFEKDKAKMQANARMKDWWVLCDPMQQPLPTRKAGEWWAVMEEVFHLD